VHIEFAQFEKKMRKLFIDEVGGVKMKKNEKKVFCNLEKPIFLHWLQHIQTCVGQFSN
jgi:hypothetical protein